MRFSTFLLPASLLITPLLAIPANTVRPQNRPPTYQSHHTDTKYFHEPGGSDELGHYDIRYFKESVSYEERGFTLQNLIRSYLAVFRENNIETWIAHGTLLGWWWNGKIMPWDWDLDTQVSASTLTWLGENMNMTYHNFTTTPEGSGTRQYLLDINPNHIQRERGDGMNVIDARWIDTTNGLYIDITGLSETHPERQPGVWSCKNYHHYRTRDIYPLRETVFEGMWATVPYAFDSVLVGEYSSRALSKTMHEGHTWNPSQKEWIKNEQTTINLNTHSARSHIPRSIEDSSSSSGFGNLFKAL